MSSDAAATRTRWFHKCCKAALGACIPLYLAANFVNRELGFLASLQIPVLTASVLIIIASLERVERGLAAQGDIQVRMYPCHGDFYRDLRNHVDGAQRTIYTTYLRRYAPGALGESALAYFHECAAWAERSPDHHFRRVIASNNGSGEMNAWVSSEGARASQLQSKGSNYRVRLLPWELQNVDAISVAIIDSEYVFVTFSGEEDRLSGFSLKGQQLVQEYFQPYYDKLWNASVPVGEDTHGHCPSVASACEVTTKPDLQVEHGISSVPHFCSNRSGL